MRANFQSELSPLPPKMYAAPAIPQDVPCYRILKQCFLDDVMYFEGDIVTWTEEPNAEMEPLNDFAREASDAFFDKVEAYAREFADANKKRFIPVRRPFGDERRLSTADARRVELIKGDGGVPVMGARRPPKSQKLELSRMEQRPIADLARKGKEAANAVKDVKHDS